MTDYIVCPKKRNAPRVHLRVCEERCTDNGSCQQYLAGAKLRPGLRDVPIHRERSSTPPNPV